ncbi:MAG: hypothetical protein ACRCYY_01240 [Trueperaceae bacterium]
MTCPFELSLPESLSILSHNLTETSNTYRILKPEDQRALLASVREQLLAQGWTRAPTQPARNTRGSSQMIYQCKTFGQHLQVSFSAVGKSNIYTLSLKHLE